MIHAFLERRTKAKEKEKEQIIIQIVFTFIFFSGFVIPGLDKRFGWSDVPVLYCYYSRHCYIPWISSNLFCF